MEVIPHSSVSRSTCAHTLTLMLGRRVRVFACERHRQGQHAVRQSDSRSGIGEKEKSAGIRFPSRRCSCLACKILPLILCAACFRADDDDEDAVTAFPHSLLSLLTFPSLLASHANACVLQSISFASRTQGWSKISIISSLREKNRSRGSAVEKGKVVPVRV